ncbi:MAG: ABC transporter ATP-binding protein [Clostridia bacterium]|nr:ABC transporter ATP-binding protein [Clostridia bacterium]
MLSGEHITVRYGNCTVVDDLSFQLSEGEWLMLAGPNGAGKSTLIEAIAQGVPYSGSIRWNQDDIRTLKGARLAQRIGVLSQKNNVSYAYTVEEVVSLGRYAYKAGLFSGRDDPGKALVEKALEMTGLTELRHASMLTLSGGETQRVFLAQVFAQNPQVLILDEPANHLDLKYQKHIFSLIREWLNEPGRAVLSVVHDLSLARHYGSHAVLMDHGKMISRGTINEVMTPAHLQQVYGMNVYEWMREMLSQWQFEGENQSFRQA